MQIKNNNINKTAKNGTTKQNGKEKNKTQKQIKKEIASVKQKMSKFNKKP